MDEPKQEMTAVGECPEVSPAPPAQKPRYRNVKRLLIAGKLLVSVSLLLYVLHKIQPGNLVQSLAGIEPKYMLAGGLIFLTSNIMGSYLWGLLLKSQGLRIPFYRVWSFYFVGLFFNNFLPANIGGDIVRIYDASKYCKDTSSVFVATFMDRVIGVLAISFLAVVASVYCLDHFRIFLIYLTVVLGFFGTLFVVFSILDRRILAFFEKPFKLVKAFDLERRVEKLFDQLHSYRQKLPLLFTVILIAVGIQILRVYVHYLVARSLGISISPSYFFLFVPVLAVLTALPISINGLGVREGAGVVLFGLAGVPGHDAFSIEFITYLVSVVISLTGGVIFLSRAPMELLRRRNSRAGSPSRAVGETDWRK
ncbi:MAG: flippase-like domain-containing protein [Candidatus Eisenbacteria bacterium]|nr:flippase-like domain-containing protein [Candidatus Eisenbacteria bacterium]